MTKNSFYRCKSISDNGGQKNLELCEKALPSNSSVVRLWVHPVVPAPPPPPPTTSPTNVVAKKSTQFHPFCSKFNFVWGGRGGFASFSNITGKAPTLLTSIVV